MKLNNESATKCKNVCSIIVGLLEVPINNTVSNYIGTEKTTGIILPR